MEIIIYSAIGFILCGYLGYRIFSHGKGGVTDRATDKMKQASPIGYKLAVGICVAVIGGIYLILISFVIGSR